MRATIPSTSKPTFRIHYKETGAVWKLSTKFLEEIPFHLENLTFLCIGTDRSTGDALGPLTGSHLSEQKTFPFSVIGTLAEPAHALNLEERIQEIQQQHPDSFIIAIDACLGKGTSVGQFLFEQAPMLPGQGVGKNLPAVGHMSIKGVVNIAGFMEHAVLQSTRLHLSFEMSRILARALQLAYSRYHSQEMNNRNNYTDNQYARH